MKNSRKDLVAAQKNFFKQVFKYEAGMMCAACNGDYSNFLTKNSDGSFTMKVKKDTCTRLQKSCYKYLVERNTASKYLEQQAKAKKGRQSQKKMKDQIELWNEKCRGTDEGCSKEEKEKIFTGVLKEANNAQTLTQEEKTKLKAESKMVVQMPEGCTSEDNCQWICDNMVGATGAKNESQYKGLDSNTTRRMLAEIKTEYTAQGGYEPDSDENTEGFDTEFVEDIPVLEPESDSDSDNKMMMIIGLLIVLIIGGIIGAACCMGKKNQTAGQTQYQNAGGDEQNVEHAKNTVV